MKPLTHTVRRQTLAVQCDSMDLALGLNRRIRAFNVSHLLPVIERVFDEVDIAGRQIRIERLEIELGDIPASEFEDLAPARLYRELKEAVGRALASPFESHTQSEQAARIELVEYYLLRGSLPVRTASAASFSLDVLFAELTSQAPAALARLVRTTAAREHALDRMVYQLSNQQLRRLVAVLEPDHASLILAYMLDLSAVQREDAIAAAEAGEFDHLLWFLVFSYLVHEAGSQFNRRMFVQSLIRGFAERQGTNYERTLEMLGRALARTMARRGLPSSLPAVIADLIREADLVSPSLLPKDVSTGEPVPAAMEPAALARLVLSRGASAAWLRELVNALDEAALVALLTELEPQQARFIVAFLFDVRDVHRAMPASSGEPAQFDRLLWLLTLTWAVERSGSEFNRKTFLLSLLHRLAHNEGLDFAVVTSAFRLGLARVAIRSPLRSSLPAMLAAILADLDRSGPGVPDTTEDGAHGIDVVGFESVLSYAGGANRQALQALLEGIESLSGADRPGQETLCSALLAETLSWNPGREMDRGFFERVLARSFPQPLPERIRQALLAAVPERPSGLRDALLLPDSPPLGSRSLEEIVAALVTREADSLRPDDPAIGELEAALEAKNAPEALRELLSDRRLRDRLPGILPQTAWESLVRALYPGGFHDLREAEPVLAAAWVIARPGSRDSEVRHTIRVAALEAMTEGTCSVETFTTRVLRHLRRAQPKDPEAEGRFRLHIGRLAVDKGVSSLRNPISAPVARRRESPRKKPLPEETADFLYIGNAGIVLASPFLPQLFSTLGMMGRDGKGRGAWLDPRDALRGVHILQYLVDERTDMPEPELILNKILCGLPVATPVERGIELTEREAGVCGQMLNALLASWSVISNTAKEGLRETFLQREGRLNREGEVWKMRVQRKTLDVLVDQIPWSFSMISHDWMPNAVQVTW